MPAETPAQEAPRDAPEDAPEEVPEAASKPAVDPSSGWERLQTGDVELPAGIGLVLRTSHLVGIEDGVARIEVLEGPGLDRLRGAEVRSALARALSDVMGMELTVEVSTPGGDEEPTAKRITPETVKEGRVQALVEDEPKLEKAVETLDLELMD
jgi:hypothetical protein